MLEVPKPYYSPADSRAGFLPVLLRCSPACFLHAPNPAPGAKASLTVLPTFIPSLHLPQSFLTAACLISDTLQFLELLLASFLFPEAAGLPGDASLHCHQEVTRAVNVSLSDLAGAVCQGPSYPQRQAVSRTQILALTRLALCPGWVGLGKDNKPANGGMSEGSATRETELDSIASMRPRRGSEMSVAPRFTYNPGYPQIACNFVVVCFLR